MSVFQNLIARKLAAAIDKKIKAAVESVGHAESMEEQELHRLMRGKLAAYQDVRKLLMEVDQWEFPEQAGSAQVLEEALEFYAANQGKVKTLRGAFIECDPDAGPLYHTEQVHCGDNGERAREALKKYRGDQ